MHGLVAEFWARGIEKAAWTAEQRREWFAREFPQATGTDSDLRHTMPAMQSLRPLSPG
jgi:hypothetical protein